MKASKLKFLPVLMGVTILITVGIRWSIGSPDGNYLTLLDRFEVTGPGAWSPGWFDDFDNGLPDGWTNMGAFGPIGTWQDEPGTTFARLESPGGDLNVPTYGVHWDRTTIFSYQIWQSYVSARRGNFQGTATFAAELPHLNQYVWLYLGFPRFIDGRQYQEQIHVAITNYAPEIASLLGLPGGLQVEQKRFLYDAVTWKTVKSSDFRSKSITPPESLGKVILSIRYLDDPLNPRFIPCYSLTDPAEFVVPFPERPIASNLHLSDLDPAWWSITTGILVPIIPVDIRPGSCPNPINPKSKGVLPVALLGTEDFDATIIDPATLELKREGEEFGAAPLRWAYEDVATPFKGGGTPCECHDLDGDGYLDLTLKFDVQEVVSCLGGVREGDKVRLILTGKLKEEFGGTPVRGQDCVWLRSK